MQRPRSSSSLLGAALLATGLIAAGCSGHDAGAPAAPAPSTAAAAAPAKAAAERVDPATARRLVAAGATLLDVRTPDEYAGGHLDGARSIPVDDLAGRLGELPRDRDVVVYCHSGRRSGRAARLLTEAGYRVHDLGPMPVD
ncbi:MAG: rhodanese-like domain-containing protein [Kofleriaceae bacterium]|nr:rhodanese-like domain-containing protein [Kofleriaceae bacterium]MCB9572500.1 rhodanese-like domain-containing protein [Kofleriaceae bacterium]